MVSFLTFVHGQNASHRTKPTQRASPLLSPAQRRSSWGGGGGLDEGGGSRGSCPLTCPAQGRGAQQHQRDVQLPAPYPTAPFPSRVRIHGPQKNGAPTRDNLRGSKEINKQNKTKKGSEKKNRWGFLLFLFSSPPTPPPTPREQPLYKAMGRLLNCRGLFRAPLRRAAPRPLPSPAAKTFFLFPPSLLPFSSFKPKARLCQSRSRAANQGRAERPPARPPRPPPAPGPAASLKAVGLSRPPNDLPFPFPGS